jgi:hypothetical protein
MRIHSDVLHASDLDAALRAGKSAGRVDPGVHFVDALGVVSRQRRRAWEVRLVLARCEATGRRSAAAQ